MPLPAEYYDPLNQWYADRLAHLETLSDAEVLKVLDDQLLKGALTLRGVDLFKKGLKDKSCPNHPDAHLQEWNEAGVFLVYVNGKAVDGGHYCDPEEALAHYESFANGVDDVHLAYL